MSLVQQAQTALANLCCPAQFEQPINVSGSGQRFSVNLTAIDSIACAFTDFTLESDKLAPAPIEQLRKVAENLSARLTYLLEAIRPIEIDPDQCVVQMRSSPPQRNEDRTSYYELLVAKGGRLTLSRYEKPSGGLRQVVPAHLTREVFWRLLRDFSEVAG